VKSRTGRWVVWVLTLVVCVVCGWLSLYLTRIHYARMDGLLTDVCKAFSTSSCEKVAQNRWAWVPPLPESASDGDTSSATSGPANESKAADSSSDGETLAEQQLKANEAKQKADKEAQERWYRVSTAQLGLMYFTFMFWWLLFTGSRPMTRWWIYGIVLAIVWLGVLASAFFEVIMWTQMENWCPLCVGTHVGCLLIAIGVSLLWPSTVSQNVSTATMPSATGLPADWSWPTNRVVVTTLLIVLVSFMWQRELLYGLKMWNQSERTKYTAKDFEKRWIRYERSFVQNYLAWAATPKVHIPLDGRPMRGSPNAPRTLVIFGDFECSPCKKFETFFREKVQPMAQQAPEGGFKIYFKHWPICKDCNEGMQGPTRHPLACQAAYAAEAARILGGDAKFWEMHDLLYEHQSEWMTSKDFLPYAQRLGLDKAQFIAAMDSNEAKERVRADAQDGLELGKTEITDADRRAEIAVTSTPAIFVDGRRFDSWSTTDRAMGIPRAWSMMLGSRDAFNRLLSTLQQTALPAQQSRQPGSPTVQPSAIPQPTTVP